MKILLCAGPNLDYGLDALFDGLCQVLGPENVYEYPNKYSYHGIMRKSLQWYPCFFDYPDLVSDEEKITLLKNNEFDLIIVGCRQSSDYLTPELKDLLVQKSKTIPIYLVDQDDDAGINTNLMSELNGELYFKREYFPNTISDPKVLPLSFSYPNKYLPDSINYKRDNLLFWAGKVIPSREPFIKICQEMKGRPFYGYKQDSYRNKLLINTLCLNLKGRGNDTVRYYEIPAHGALLLTEKIDITLENAFVDGETCVTFESPEEMKEKIIFCLDNPSYRDKIRLAGYKLFNEHHTSKIRAQQFLDKIKDQS